MVGVIVGTFIIAFLSIFAGLFLYGSEVLDISFAESWLFFVSLIGSLWFLMAWYVAIAKAWPKDKRGRSRFVLTLLPPAAFLIITVILRTIADPTVAESAFWTFFYVLLGFLWVSIGMFAANYFFDLSWRDDVLNQTRDQPALYPVIGSFIGLSLIYAGANIGEGPGWWCVLFAGGLGIAAWLVLGYAVHKVTGAFDTVTIDRDAPCGIRMGFYLAASGLILGKASSGDWTSFGATVIEFLIGWYILPLTLVAIYVEKLYAKKRQEKLAAVRSNRQRDEGSAILPAFAWGMAYIIIAIVTVTGVTLWM